MPGFNVRVYECEVSGVSENDRLVDLMSRNGTSFKGVSYLLPWISATGSGIDCIPKTGDQCLALATPPKTGQGSQGRMVFVLGFKIPTSPEYEGQELGGRIPDLPQGSMAIRAIADDGSEALVLCTAGGSVLISSNDICRTLYSPVDSSVTTIFDKWQLIGPGGFVKWNRQEGSDAVFYEAQYFTSSLATNPETAESAEGAMVVRVRIGGEQEDPVDISIGPDLEANPFLRLRVNTDGEAFIEGESITVNGRAGVTIEGANITINGRQVLGQGDPI